MNLSSQKKLSFSRGKYKSYLYLVIIYSVIMFVAEFALRVIGFHDNQTLKDPITGGYMSRYDSKYNSYYEIPGEPGEHVSYDHGEFTRDYILNNLGFRDEQDFNIHKTKFRILTLGDSFTEGIGASNDSVWQKMLENMLQMNTETEIWNCGTAGSDPCFAYVLLRDKLVKFKPDMVILTINDSDFFDLIIRGGFERFKDDGKVLFKKQPFIEKIYQHIYISRYPINKLCEYYFEPVWKRQEISDVANRGLIVAIDSFSTFCNNNKCQLMVIFHPREADFDIPYRFDAVVNWADANGLAYVDVKEEFKKFGITKNNKQNYYWKYDGHFNNAGYYYFAKCIAGKLNP